MTTVRAIVSEGKHAEGLTKFAGQVLDIGSSSINVPEWIRRVRTWMELYAIDGTASGLSATPFIEPVASFPKENGPNSWIPTDPDTGDPAALDEKTKEKLKGAKFVSYAAIQVNLANQARVIFQVLLYSAISKQSQAAVKNSVEWAALSVDLNQWAQLLNVIVRVHTIQKGAMVGESAIVAKFAFDSKIRTFKQISNTDSGAHLERFDDLVAEGKAIGASLDQRELAYLVVNSMKSSAARNKRSLLMDLGHNTPQTYAVAKAFILEAEAMARSVAEFNAGHSNRGHVAVTDHSEYEGKVLTDISEADPEGNTNLVTAPSKGNRRIYTAQQRKNWKMLDTDAKKKVTELEQLADKIRAGETIDVDLRTITSTLTSSIVPRTESKRCWKCKGDHVMSECPQKETIKGAPHAPARKVTWKKKSQGEQKKSETVALVQESVQEEDSDEDYFYHLDNLVTYRGCWKNKRAPTVQTEAGLFLDDSEESDCDGTCASIPQENCFITGEPIEEEQGPNEQQIRRLGNLKGLSTAVRKPTDEEIAFQADLIAMPHLCRSELQRNSWQTVSINGVTVVKGGCFDTSKTSVVWLNWGRDEITDEAQSKPGGERPKLTAKRQQKRPDEDSLKKWMSAGNYARKKIDNEIESSERESDEENYEQLQDLRDECDEATKQLEQTQKDLRSVCSQLDLCYTEKRQAQLEYERALQVVRDVAEKELDRVKKESAREIYRMQSEIEKNKAELKMKEKVVSEVEAEAISGSLRRSLERNTHLVNCLEKADAENALEKQQVQYFQRALEQERLETKALNQELAAHRLREEERVSAYSLALERERQISASLRRTLKDLEMGTSQHGQQKTNADEEIDRLSKELREVELRLLRSIEKETQTEERLKDAEHTSKEAMEELDRHRAIYFAQDQKGKKSPNSETRSQGSGGQYDVLSNTWPEEEESADEQESGSNNNRKRNSEGVDEEISVHKQNKKSKRSQKGTPPKKLLTSSDTSVPVFDPYTMRQITPIFGQPGSSQKGKTEDEEDKVRTKKRETRLRNELSRLAPQNGIDLIGYTSRRTERRDADEAAALEREKAKARKFILWNCSQAIEVRANLRVTEFSVRDVDIREKMYKDVLTKSKEDGPAKFMDLLNEECRYSNHNKLTSEWLEDQVRLWLRNPKERQKPIKLPMPPRDPVYYQKLIDEREKRESDKKSRAKQVANDPSEPDEKASQRKKDIEYSEEGESDAPPALLNDSDTEEEDKGPNPRNACREVEEEKKGAVNERIAGESLATVVRGHEQELTIHDYDVLTLDNGASTHIFRNREMAHSLKPVKGGGVNIGGLKSGGDGVHCTEKGMFLSVEGVLIGEESIANLLSQGMLVDQGHYVAYDTPTDVYTVRFRGTGVSLEFRRQRKAMKDHRDMMMKHYVRRITPQDIREETALIATIKEKQRKYTKVEIAEAVKAREQSAILNFPSQAAHLDMIEQGSIDGNTVTKEALARSIDIWGRPTERSKGNNVQSKPTAASKRIDALPEQASRQNSAHMDLLFVKGLVFIIAVLEPMKYVWVHRLLSRVTDEIRKGMDKFFADMRSHRVVITCVRSDGEGGLWALESEIKMRGARMDKPAAGKHVELAERKIRQVKEGVRRAIASLPYLLCRMLLIACVYHAAQCINLQRTTSQIREGLPSPYDQLTGQRIDASIHMISPFGAYVEATVRETDNTTAPRTDSAIYCSSALQATEANHVYLIRTNEMALRGKCEKKPMSQAMIEILDKKARKDWGEQAKDIYFGENEYTPETQHEKETEDEREVEDPPIADMRVTRSMTSRAGGLDNYELDQAIGQSSISAAHEEQEESEGEEQAEQDIKTPERNSTDNGGFRESGFWDRHGPAETAEYFREGYLAAARLDMGSSPSPSRELTERRETEYVQSLPNGADSPHQQQYEVLLMKELAMRKDWYHKEYALVMSQKQAIKRLGEKIALPAISKELKQLLDKKVWRPVKWNDLTEKEMKEAINSHMFLKEKHDALGNFDKLKGRLVARGDEQDRGIYDNLSSPTARLTSLFSIVAIAACEGRKVEVGDIPGAYLNADMKNKVVMRINKVMSSEICKIDNSYLEYLDKKGCLSVVLLKAMYGCVQSAKLWNENLSKALTSAGFVANPEDPCVFNKGSITDEDQITVIIYVDDLMATCKKQEPLDELWKVLRSHYAKPGQPDIDVKKGPLVNYLGMTFDWTLPGKVRITQLGFQSELIAESGIDTNKRIATSPAAENLFDTRSDEEAGEIEQDEKDRFHRMVAKCLYLAKRTRPEILTTVAFLCTRVTKSNLDDVKKLDRLLSYISGTKERGIVLCPGLRGIQVRTFVDAAYGVHADFKSSSGSTTVLGDAGPISANSSKQSIVTKSSMEAELVASSDMMNEPFHVRRMLVAQGYSPGPIVLYQDNLSCMALIAKGRAGSGRTRHISIRYYWIKQHVDSGDVVVEKLATEEMPANILTKPLQGEQFRYERKLLTNWED